MAVTVAIRHSIVVASDVTVFDEPHAIFVGTGGDINIRLIGDSSPVLYKNIPDGTFLPVLADMVYSTLTTAADIVKMSN